MADAMKKLSKTDYIPFLDTKGTGDTAVWSRIDLTTLFSLNPNPQTESKDYISMEVPIEEVKNYIPELPQEIATYEGNPIYDFIFKMFYNLPTGSACNVPFLMCFGGSEKLAWQTVVTVVLGELNTIEGKLSFSLKIGGDIERGTYVITDGKPVFTKKTIV